MFALDPEIRDQAYQFFAQEALEFLQTLEEGLLTLRQDRSVPKVHALMRAAHSIKGSAASVGLSTIQALAHQLEDVMRALYREDVMIDLALEEMLLQAYDCLRVPLLAQIQTGSHDEEAALLRAEPIFTELAERLGDALQMVDTALPTAAELGVDIVQVVFEGDVKEGINRLATVLTNPEQYEVGGEIRAQAEVFAGVGELLNLPGFTAIARTMLAALQAHPDRMEVIGHIALADLQSARAMVLGGDRQHGGEPSDQLLQLAQTEISIRDPSPAALFETLDLSELEAALGQSPDDPPLLFDASLDGSSDDMTDATPDLTPELTFEPPRDRTQPAPESPRSPESTGDAASPYLSNTVRVDLPRLERLNNLVGELMTQENGSSLHNQQLQGVVNRVSQRFTRFEYISQELQTWSDRNQKNRARLQSAQTHSGKPASDDSRRSESATPLMDFDPLQMDSYSDLHTLVQETLEEIAQVGEAMRDMVLLMQQSQQRQRQKQQTLKQIRNDLLWARMLPLGDILRRFPRMVRDLSAQYDKQAVVKLIGATTLVDKAVLEKLYDPLVHLVRNAFDHGLESPAVRQTIGKSAQATIAIRAYHRGNQTYIEVQDDGRGIDLEAVRTKAIALQLVTADVAPTRSPEQLYEFLFAPGFSTTVQVSELSGRGMGLDTVRSQVKGLKGTITVSSEPGQGTTFILRLPLTLTIAKLLVFSANSHLMAIPIDTMVEIAAAPVEQIQTIQGEQFFHWQDHLIPIYPPDIFHHNYLLLKPTSEQIQPMSIPRNGRIPLLLIASESHIVALQVDHILQEQELVIKPFGQAVAPPPYLYGCTILGDGSLVPVIDGAVLIHQKQAMVKATAKTEAIATITEDELPLQNADRLPTPGSIKAPSPASSQPSTILIIDDSLTTRHNLALTLKKAGYKVVQARDGREALEHLQLNPDIHAVFSDVEMPRMNGFEFLNHCRQKFSKSTLPVIMLSSRSSDKHRQIAQAMGASSYLIKPYLEQELLQTLQRLLTTVNAASI